MLATQLALAAGIAGMGLLSPVVGAAAAGAAGRGRGLFSATQDIAFDAYSTDVLRKEERGAGAP